MPFLEKLSIYLYFGIFRLTAAAATATATSQQISHLARALNHHAQGPNIPFGVNPSLRLYILV